jgi:hypothetical protein
MEKVEQLALISVSRAVGFATLAIGILMLGLSADLPNCLKAGGILTLITSLVLLMKGLRAPQRDYRRTEVWIMMNPNDRPSAAVAQGVIGKALKRTYLTFALHLAAVSGGLLLLATAFSLSAGSFGVGAKSLGGAPSSVCGMQQVRPVLSYRVQDVGDIPFEQQYADSNGGDAMTSLAVGAKARRPSGLS